ncbi:MAG: TIGR03862 family flavoprotein [Verrucomicrobiales bacterium]|nr:TIGR03862 family flavoprotein [Verrucomicrobiales bacterium]
MAQDGKQKKIVVAGGGPAGLRAAEVAAESGADVVVLEAKRYVGRKFLVAGKSGLNLTNAESPTTFAEKYTGSAPANRWQAILGEFCNDDLRAWAGDLGFETFESSGGKVFPRPMKTAPLLRAWMKRLDSLGVKFRFKANVHSLEPGQLTLDSGEHIAFDAAVLAFGGASWPSTGSDGTWLDLLAPHGVAIAPFQPANCGWQVNWPAELIEVADGLPLKNVVARCGTSSVAGELMVTRYGLEGGPVYHLGPVLRGMEQPEIFLDLKPEISLEEVKKRLCPVKKNFVREARRRLRISNAGAALLKYLPNLGPWKDPEHLATVIKNCPVALTGPRPIAEAISSAGGIVWGELDRQLMLKKIPGVFVAGEMIDWEAPTGGYLLQGCFATGTIAGKGASAFAEKP